jgi:hypothetical protein
MGHFSAALAEFDRDLDQMPFPPDLSSSLELVVKRFEEVMSKAGGELVVGGTVRRQDIRRWLGDRLQTRPLAITSREPTNDDLKRILDWPMRFVPVQIGAEVIVSDRSVLAEHIAALALKDLQARPLVTRTAVETEVMLRPIGADISERAIDVPPEADITADPIRVT